jgi:hypothetical protein
MLKDKLKLIGKRVRVTNITMEGEDVVGTLQFVGYNPMMGGRMQATVDRMPIVLKSWDQISLEKPRTTIIKNE